MDRRGRVHILWDILGLQTSRFRIRCANEVARCYRVKTDETLDLDRKQPWPGRYLDSKRQCAVALPTARGRTPTPHPPVDSRAARSEEPRVGKECVGPCNSRWSPAH